MHEWRGRGGFCAHVIQEDACDAQPGFVQSQQRGIERGHLTGVQADLAAFKLEAERRLGVLPVEQRAEVDVVIRLAHAEREAIRHIDLATDALPARARAERLGAARERGEIRDVLRVAERPVGGGVGELKLRVEPVARAVETRHFRRARRGVGHDQRARFPCGIGVGVQGQFADFHAPGLWQCPAEMQRLFSDANFQTRVRRVGGSDSEQCGEKDEERAHGQNQ